MQLKERIDLSILVVDDTPLVLTLMCAILNGLGIKRVQTAESIQVALDKIQSLDGFKFDVVFLDLYLGKKSGLVVLEAIRARNKTVPVIMLTQEDQGAKIVECIQYGATDYVLKPFTEEIIWEKIKSALRAESN